MLKKLLVALVASAFALGARAPKAEPKADTKTEAKKDEKAEIDQSTKKTKSTKSTKAKSADAKAKDAPKEPRHQVVPAPESNWLTAGLFFAVK